MEQGCSGCPGGGGRVGARSGQGGAEDTRPCRAVPQCFLCLPPPDSHLCPLEPPHPHHFSHPVLPTFPKIVGCEAFLICHGVVKLLWEGLS